MTDYSDCKIQTYGSDYTIKLGGLVSLGYDTDAKLGLDKYPIFDEDYRPTLNHKIVAHYALREIGVETPEQFVFYLRRTMNEIMPYYNKLYESDRLKFDPLSTMSIESVSSNDSDSQMSSQSSSEDKTQSKTDTTTDTHNQQRTVDSVAPDAQLSGTGDYAGNVQDIDAKNHSDTSAKTNATGTNTSKTDFSSSQSKGNGNTQTKGYSGLPTSDLIQRYRASLLNIDMMIITELGSLFMGVSDTMDSMAPRGYDRILLW